MARWPPPLRAMVVLGQPHERRSRPRSRSLALTLRCSSVDGHVLGRRRRCRLVLPRDKGGTSVNRQSEARGQCAYGSHCALRVAIQRTLQERRVTSRMGWPARSAGGGMQIKESSNSRQAGLAITFLRLSTRFLASSRVLSILTRTTVPTIAYGRSLRTEISTLTGRGGHTAHHCKVPQSETHKHTQT